jgi:Rieske Fe-S protein
LNRRGKPEGGATSEEPEQGERKGELPGPSLWPIGVAVGIACVLVGLIVSWWVVAIGGAITLFFGLLWIFELGGGSLTLPSRPAREPAPGEPTRRQVEGPPSDRKGFLAGATLAMGAVIGAAVAIPPTLFALLPPFLKQDVDDVGPLTPFDVDLGPVASFTQDEWVISKFFLEKKSGEVYRRTAYVRYNGLLEDPETRKPVPSFTILSNHCVHLGCPVQPNGPVDEEGKKVQRFGGRIVERTPVIPAGFGCPCHGGQYDTEGNRTAGPPVRALDRYAYDIRDSRLVIVGYFSVSEVSGTGKDAVIQKYKLAAPGVHVDGWEQIFYPFVPPS